MKVRTWIKYEESYLPPRCRKLRYRECEEYVDLNLKEVSADALRLAFEDNAFQGKGKIFFYNGKLWSKAVRNRCIAEEYRTRSALEDMLWAHEHCSTYFRFSWDREERGRDTSRAGVLKDARRDMRGFILVNGELYSVTSEPRYCVYTFGLGCNHGGTALSVDYRYNPNISKQCYFSALQGAEAVGEAKRIALGRGDTESISRFKANIEVFMPELVKVNPRRQHGNGNKLLNEMEAVVSGAKDPFLAGLLCMATAASCTESGITE